MTIVQFDVDEAEWVGDEHDGCYVQVQYIDGMDEGDCCEGWYATVVVDSDTGSFVDDLETDTGPFETKDEALEHGYTVAANWCIDNGVSFE
jgi:hypothetical protein